MQITPEQVKGKIKNVAKETKTDARTLMRICAKYEQPNFKILLIE